MFHTISWLEYRSLILFVILCVLDLHFNQIHGKIPILPPFARYVDFSNNNFSSSIPMDIRNYFSFSATFFFLSNNSLTGVIPKSICNATFLEVIDLSYNCLNGIIPPCLSERIDTLAVLNLRSNQLSSLLPDAFSVNCSLKTMDLDGTAIQGQIPKSLANCNELEILDLGHSKMMDSFPCFLKSISTLRVLVLRSNKFYGSMECSGTNET